MQLAISRRIFKPFISDLLVSLIAFSIPIGSGINLITGLPFSRLFLVATLLIIMYAIFFMKLSRYITPLFIQLYIALMLIHTLITYTLVKTEYLHTLYYGEIFYVSLIRFIVYILFFLFISQYLREERHLSTFVLFYSLGYVFTFILGLFVPAPELDQGRINGGFENPNSFGASSILLIFLNLYMFLQEKPGTARIYRFLPFLLFGFAGIALSQSRGALAGLLGGVFFYTLWMPGLARKIKILFGVVLGLGLILIFIPADVLHQFMERANISERISTKSESRVVIWESYLRELKDFWFLGAGRNQAGEVILKYNLPLNWRAPHNRYLFILVEFGLLALMFFLLGLFQVFRRFKHAIISYFSGGLLKAFMIAWMVMMLFGDYKNSRDFWLFLAVICTITFLAGSQKETSQTQN